MQNSSRRFHVAKKIKNRKSPNLEQKSKISFWRGFAKTVFRYPATFFKYISLENYHRLVHAIRTEPPGLILQNFKNLLTRTKHLNTNDIQQHINNFINKIPLSNDKKTVLFVTHEVTRTGAPLIILQLAKDMTAHHNVNPVFLTCRGGDMAADFSKFAPTYHIVHGNDHHTMRQELDHLIKQLRQKTGVQFVYVNSVESRQVLPFLHKNGIEHVITLIHELGLYYPKNAWKIIDDHSDKIIFPANFVRDLAIANTPFATSKIVVRGQGLLKPEILDADQESCRKKIRKELALPPDSLIVLGCGATIARKGIDVFVTTAISTLNRLKNASVYFIWLGDGDFNLYKLWTQRDIDQSGWKKNIRFIGSRKDTIPYFAGSDIFFMTSKGDPFPCVVHEALAAELPVVGFNNAGGFVDLMDEEQLAPYGDVGAITNILYKLCTDNEYRRLKSEDSKKKIESWNFKDYSNFVYQLGDELINCRVVS